MPKTLTSEELQVLIEYLAESQYNKKLQSHFVKQSKKSGFVDWDLAAALWQQHKSITELKLQQGAILRPEFDAMKAEIRRQLDENELTGEELSRRIESMKTRDIAKPYDPDYKNLEEMPHILGEPCFAKSDELEEE